MERPQSLDPSLDIRERKIELMRSIRPIKAEDLVTGQYAGYQEEVGVKQGSMTATYAAAVLYVDNDRWKGVPVLLVAGKALDQSTTFIKIHFKSATQNILTLRVQPDPGYSFDFTSRVSGSSFIHSSLGDKETACSMAFTYSRSSIPLLGAYEIIFGGICERKEAEFVSSEEVIAGWNAFDPALAEADLRPPEMYAVGSKGPFTAVEELVKRHICSSTATSASII